YNYSKISTGKYFFPAFYDIDNDGDFDLFAGRENGQLSFYQNIGTPKSPTWAKPDTAYANIQTNQIRNSPVFHDIDNDGDADLFIGTYSGNIIFYRNVGNRSAAKFEFITTDFDRINVGSSAKPVFADIDDDGDADLFLGEDDGGIDFFRNNGRVTAIDNMPATHLAISAYSLEQNYPNPFNPSTKIRYQLTRPVLVNLTIYNIHGQKVENLLNQYQPAGIHEIVWNAQYLSGGIYYCQLQAGDYSETRKLIYLK
ncbi:T9SS type A sorting domain-containing protein, partial [candidate division KSB1 bacterium]|nr:T9SS type A sorting domain-containing protein [candidate division KSB1 bacterium]